ncbi:MAG: HNH endonuclease, partial [Methylococcaceae bacterium]
MKPSKKIVYLMLIALCNISLVYAKQERSQEAKDSFKYSHPCPSNGNNHGPCPGYVIDHIKPLTCDGADDPSNMQWQTKAEGKAKDKWERKGCKTDSSGSRSTESGSYQTGPKEAALPIQQAALKNMWRIPIVGIDIHKNC